METTENIRLSIGLRLKELRENKNITIRQLSEMTGYNYANISKIENGKYSAGIDIIYRIADALQCRLEIVEK
jgi:transcriptional regulator with XRE-family HTH domain